MATHALSSEPSTELVSIKIVHELAAVEGIDPTELTPPLHEHIDTDAVDAIFGSRERRPPPTDARLTFEYQGHLVVVEGTGRVSVEPNSASRVTPQNR